MADKETMPGASGNTNTDLRAEIEMLFETLIMLQSDLYSKMAMKLGDLTIQNTFTMYFYPKWNSYFNITLLGFDKAYADKAEFSQLKTRAAKEISTYRESPSIGQVKQMLDTFNEYTEHVKEKSMIKIRS